MAHATFEVPSWVPDDLRDDVLGEAARSSAMEPFLRLLSGEIIPRIEWIAKGVSNITSTARIWLNEEIYIDPHNGSYSLDRFHEHEPKETVLRRYLREINARRAVWGEF